MRTWRIEAVAVFPVELGGSAPPGQLPQHLERVSRIPSESGTFGTATVTVEAVELPYFKSDGLHEPAAVRFHVEAEEGHEAFAVATPILEDLVETLSFQMQQLVPLVQLEALDVTPPVGVDDEREGMLFPYPAGPPLPKFGASIQMGGIGTALTPTLAPLDTTEARSEAALGWHLKAMASPFVAEQFMLNWIALEILWRGSGVSVETEYIANCGHAITNCPVCSKPTAREVRGASLQKYLVEVCGTDERVARRMWRIRQIFHGDVDFTSAEMNEVPALVQVLRMVVVGELKRVLGFPSDATPVVTAGSVALGPQMALGIRRKVTSQDV